MEFGDTTTGYPMLFAIDDVFIAAFDRRCSHFGGGTARIWLSDTDGGLVASKDIIGGKALLSDGAKFHHRAKRAHICSDGNPAHGQTAAHHFLYNENGDHIAQSVAAMLGWNCHSHKAAITQFGDVVSWIGLAAVSRRRGGLEGRFRQLTRSIL